ncbi:MAG: Cyclic pyranopterin monophosphate synthase [Candidatus Thorarchaeota archaeon]|nr:MAG: Cyclic pyranopterin monophosphate synthase [Candidatus Thorarchaeota archaeon]
MTDEIRFATIDLDGGLVPPFPINPIQLTNRTRELVCKNVDGIPLRKYTSFYGVGVYGGIATAYSVGCNIRCVFCWVDWSRDWPERYGQFYSPEEVYSKLRAIMAERNFRRARISGAEPTLCTDHLCSILELVHRDRYAFDLFVIETNGFVLSQEPELAERLFQYASRRGDTVGHVRLSIRGGIPEAFTAKTGCSPEFMDLPFRAVEYLWDAEVSFHVAVVIDQRFTSEEEKNIIYQRLSDIQPTIRNNVEEEYLDPYPHALVRLRAVGRIDVTGTGISEKERLAASRMPRE